MGVNPTPEQHMATWNRGGRLLVSAAAGSGKTKVLVDRLLSYLMNPEDSANLDEFLIITYTKAAAAELRGKILKKLTEKIAEDPGNLHLQHQIQRLYLSKISTVHSFCSDILREYAYRLDLPADFRVAEESECEEIKLEVLDQLLESAYENVQEHPDFWSFMEDHGLGRDDRKIPEIILKVYHSARCHLEPSAWLHKCVEDCCADQIQDVALTPWGRYLTEDLRHYLDLQCTALNRCAELAEQNGTMPKVAELLKTTIGQIKALAACRTWDEIHAFSGIDYGRLNFPKSGVDPDLQRKIKAVRNECKNGIAKKLRSFSQGSSQILKDLESASRSARGLVELVSEFSERYDQAKLKNRILDFGDLEHKTLDLLLGKNRTGITAAAREIGNRFREIMVDEYQDSNGVQDAIFSTLSQERQNCFMVGDVKQSIYQFRLADPGIFISKYNDYEPAENAKDGQGRKIMLSQNFRSSAGVIEAVNHVFESCMSEKVGGLCYGKNEKLYEGIPHEALPDPEVELYGIQVREDTYGEEAAFAAQRIHSLLDGKHFVRSEDGLRPIRPDDIVILLRSPGSVGREFQLAVESLGIPCTMGDNGDLLTEPEIVTLWQLLEIISNPLQDIPLIGVLSSPVFGFTGDDLADFRSANRHCSVYEALSQWNAPKGSAFCKILTELRQEARFLTVSQLLQTIFEKTGFRNVYMAMEDGPQKERNLQTFCQIAGNFESGGRADLLHFLQFLEASQDRGLGETQSQAASGAVTIMSIHKSKGLEFPVVLLCGLSRIFNRENLKEQVLCHKELGLGLSCADRKNRIRYPTIARFAISARMTEESISEELRVLYVAMTRARDRLIMTYADKQLASAVEKLSSRVEFSPRELLTAGVSCPGDWVLLAAMLRTEAGELFALGGNSGISMPGEIPWKIKVAEVSEEALQMQAAAEPAEEQELQQEDCSFIKSMLSYAYPHYAATLTPSKQTATQLKGREKDQEAAESTRQHRQYQFRTPSFERNKVEGKTYGSAVHSVMEHIQYEKCRDLQGVRDEISRLEKEELITEEQGKMVDPSQIWKLFQTELGHKLISGTQILREFKFSILVDAEQFYEGVTEEEILLQGVVDCALVEKDSIIVVDYKTDRADGEKLPLLVERYRSQILAYGAALSRIYEKPVSHAYLYFFSAGMYVDVMA